MALFNAVNAAQKKKKEQEGKVAAQELSKDAFLDVLKGKASNVPEAPMAAVSLLEFPSAANQPHTPSFFLAANNNPPAKKD